MIPYTYHMVDMDGIDLADISGKVFSGLYSKILDALDDTMVLVLYNWNFAEVRIAPSYVNITIQADQIVLNGVIYINSDDTVYMPGASAPPVIESLSVTENGNYTAPSGTDGYSPVSVDVPQSAPIIESLSVTENGTYTAPSGTDGYSPVSVNVPQSSPTIAALFANSNGTYRPPSGTDGFSPVYVNVVPSEPDYEEVQPDFFGLATAYLTTSGNFNTWNEKKHCLFFAPIESGKKYVVFLPEQVGTRFRAATWAGKTIEDFSPYLDGQTTDTQIYTGGGMITPSSDLSGVNLTRRFFFAGVTGEVLIATSNTSQIIKPILLKVKEE